MKRIALMLTLGGCLMACNDGGSVVVNPPAPPPPGSLIGVVSAPKNIVTGKISTLPDELWVAKGGSVTLNVTANQLSPLAKKADLQVSGSDGVIVTPSSVKIDLNTTTSFTVKVPADFSGTKPFFFIYAYPYDQNNRKMDDQIRLDYKWDVTAPPAPPK
jgi:hypothetical protein